MATDSNQRRHPRFELFANVVLEANGEALLLPVRNLSLGGGLLSPDGNDLGVLEAGARLSFVIFDPTDEARQTAVTAQLVRQDAEGLAVTWSTDDGSSFRVAALVHALKPDRDLDWDT